MLLAQSYVAIPIPSELLQELQSSTTTKVNPGVQECISLSHGMQLSHSFSNQ